MRRRTAPPSRLCGATQMRPYPDLLFVGGCPSPSPRPEDRAILHGYTVAGVTHSLGGSFSGGAVAGCSDPAVAPPIRIGRRVCLHLHLLAEVPRANSSCGQVPVVRL